MATLTANSQGVVNGKFTVPANVPVGAKPVEAVGQGGSQGVATYTARGVIRTEERRRVFTETTTFFRADPLAQTFTLTEGRHIAGLDLWFGARDANDVIIQVRDTQSGFPGQQVFAEKRLKSSDLAASGTPTRVLFNSPVFLDGGREYAFVALTDSAVTELFLAELGKFDSANQRWITGQAYQVGVMLSSSNASTWTVHQEKDLAFRLLACKFTAASRTISLGNANVSDASDLLAELSIDIPATGTNAQLLAVAPSGEQFRMAPDTPIALPSRITGNIALSAILEGNEKASPVLYPGIQFIAGDQQDSGTYVSRAFPVGTSARVSVTFEALTPGTSSVGVEIQKSDGSWQALALEDASPVGDGWVERTYLVTGFTTPTSRVRITLTGTAQNRPRVRKLRAVATD